MSKPEKVGSIEIAQDLEFQKKSWRVQRIAWKAMLGVAVLALLGLFGSGPVSSARTEPTASGVSARYERFVRAGGEHTLTLVLTPAAIGSDSSATVWISSDWLSGNLTLSITPQPQSETVLPDRIEFRFSVAEPDSPIEARFTFEAKKAGTRRWRGGVEGDETISFTQLAYP
jgi:hypothetical protein